jgi:hypothetical protein
MLVSMVGEEDAAPLESSLLCMCRSESGGDNANGNGGEVGDFLGIKSPYLPISTSPFGRNFPIQKHNDVGGRCTHKSSS